MRLSGAFLGLRGWNGCLWVGYSRGKYCTKRQIAQTEWMLFSLHETAQKVNWCSLNSLKNSYLACVKLRKPSTHAEQIARNVFVALAIAKLACPTTKPTFDVRGHRFLEKSPAGKRPAIPCRDAGLKANQQKSQHLCGTGRRKRRSLSKVFASSADSSLTGRFYENAAQKLTPVDTRRWRFHGAFSLTYGTGRYSREDTRRG
jgi:hypothetical protein